MSTILKYVVVGLQLFLLIEFSSPVSGFWTDFTNNRKSNTKKKDVFKASIEDSEQSKKINELLRGHPFTLPKTLNFSSDQNKDDRAGHYRSRNKKNIRTAYDIIKELGATVFLQLASTVQLDSLLKNPNANITIFVPTNEAMLTVSPNIRTNLSNMNMIIRFHMVNDLVPFSDIKQNGLLDTLAKYGQDTAKYRLKIQTNIYKINNSQVVSVGGATILKPNQTGNGTIVHLLNKALYPLPIECVYYTILHHPAFSILSSFLVESITLLRVLCDEYQFHTFFAPTDDAFKKLPEDVRQKLQNDVPLLTKVFVDHSAPQIYYSAAISRNFTIKGVSGNKISLKNIQNKFLVTVDKVTGQISIPDISTINGVIHGIDTVLYIPSRNSGIDIIG